MLREGRLVDVVLDAAPEGHVRRGLRGPHGAGPVLQPGAHCAGAVGAAMREQLKRSGIFLFSRLTMAFSAVYGLILARTAEWSAAKNRSSSQGFNSTVLQSAQ